MVHPNTPRADMTTVTRWASSRMKSFGLGRSDQENSSVIYDYWRETGRGVDPGVFTAVVLRVPDYGEALWPTLLHEPDREQLRRAEEDANNAEFARLAKDPDNEDRPAILNGFMPRVLAFVSSKRESDLPETVRLWSEILVDLQSKAEVALSVAPDPADPAPDVEHVDYLVAMSSGDPALIHAWGAAMQEAVLYSRADLALHVGLETLADALVGARD